MKTEQIVREASESMRLLFDRTNAALRRRTIRCPRCHQPMRFSATLVQDWCFQAAFTCDKHGEHLMLDDGSIT